MLQTKQTVSIVGNYDQMTDTKNTVSTKKSVDKAKQTNIDQTYWNALNPIKYGKMFAFKT